jgi:2-octaprenyl-6-methoxyphenol hydroxylase
LSVGARDIRCAVVGGGPAGLITALALAHEGIAARLVHPAPPKAAAACDPRTTALFGASVELLRNLGIWAHLDPNAAPLTGLRLIDDTGALLRAPEQLFAARELGLEAFGFNVDNQDLSAALQIAVEASDRLEPVAGEVTGLERRDNRIILQLGSGRSLDASAAIAADGRNSVTRTGAGIAVTRWSYPQSAIVTRFRHARPHDGISNELHRQAGPLTTVPLPGQQSSLVWVEEPNEAARLMQLPPETFARELELRLQGLLGTIRDVAARAVFPLSGLTADCLWSHRIALVGEAAHVLPPIGAQGLNLGLRDAATLAEEAAIGRTAGRDPWDDATLDRYDRRRRADVLTRTICVDLLNRSLVSGFLPLHLARGAGLHLIGAVPWLRHLVMREGMQPSLHLPRLMQPMGPTASGR